ncbi:hypothetical protein QJS10_CPB21g00342 [Acorus calamus]|uniref:Uncharacterized protein n=1 Tax=Acorus calamus TaxID=4465 RepID=A0AAV9C6H6_ACOCL|nr:hypothetical protein QJS10_CPB21g00342 [Acorus calamus]
MAESLKLLYIVVVDGDREVEEEDAVSFRYTRSVLQSTLQLMGCKARHAFKISRRVFDMVRSECSVNEFLASETEVRKPDVLKVFQDKANDQHDCVSPGRGEISNNVQFGKVEPNNAIPFEQYKRLTTAVVKREAFLDVICEALSQYKYVGPNQRADLILACRIRERKESVTVLLCGTSGCGKSTLSALLGSRLGITTVISTDSIRHMMRSFVDEKQSPLLWASTYHAGECLDPVAVAEAKAKRKAKKLAGTSQLVHIEEQAEETSNGKSNGRQSETGSGVELISKKQMAIEGFKAQSEMVIDSLDRLITAWEERKESVVVEGVHLSLNFVRKGSSRHLMALLNTDGSVSRAWPVEHINNNGKPIICLDNEKCTGGPMYGPLQIGKAEPVNLQFGNFGISAWPADTCGTSQAGSIDGSRADGTDTGSRYYSSCCSSPRVSDAPAKELKENLSVSGSEEADDQPDGDSDEDLSDTGDKSIHEEMEGSVDEESTKTDEEYDDLAMRDGQETGYWSDDDEESIHERKLYGNSLNDRYQRNFDNFLKTREQPSEPSCYYSSMVSNVRDEAIQGAEDGQMPMRSPSDPRFLGHSQPQGGTATEKYRSMYSSDPILSGAPRSSLL